MFGYNIFWTNWFGIPFFVLQIVTKNLHLHKAIKTKTVPRGVTIEKASENIHQIYRRTPTLKCDFSKVAYFQDNLYRNTFGRFLLYKDVSWQHPIIITGIFSETFLRHAQFSWYIRLVTTFKLNWLTILYGSRLLPWIFSVIPRRNINIFTVKINVMINWKNSIVTKNENDL